MPKQHCLVHVQSISLLTLFLCKLIPLSIYHAVVEWERGGLVNKKCTQVFFRFKSLIIG